MRILYFNMNTDAPSGGAQQIYRHVETLVAHGIPAFVCLHRRQSESWHESSAPCLIASEGQLRILSDDIVVIPEVHRMPREFVQIGCRKVLFCQNQFYTFVGIGETFPSWQDAGVHEALCVSPIIAQNLEEFGGFPAENVHIVRCPVDAAPHAPSPRPLGIAYMPRRRGEDVALIRRAFIAAHPAFADVPWLPIDKLPPAEVAIALQRSAVFLSLSRREGFGLPPVEAMAAGCVVAGFHGHGGLDYASPENGFWAAEDDPLDAARQLGRAVALAATGGSDLDRYHERTAATVARYSPVLFTDDLLHVWRALLARPAG